MRDIAEYQSGKTNGQQYIGNSTYMLNTSFNIYIAVYPKLTAEDKADLRQLLDNIFNEFDYIRKRYNLTSIGVGRYKLKVEEAQRYFRAVERRSWKKLQ